MLIRHADPARDGAACASIYAPYVADGVSSFEDRPPGAHEMGSRIETLSARYPWLVAQIGDEVLGYAYATEHRTRAAYRWAAETAVYVHGAHQRQGAGARLYGALLPLLALQGLYVACAGITLPNPASVALHERFGFEPIGVYREIGFKHGAWQSVGWWLARLREQPAGQAPSVPGPPVRLSG